jgi:hypothetical protein
MITTVARLQRMTCRAVLGAALTALPADAIATRASRPIETGEQRIAVVIGPIDAAAAAGSAFGWSARLPHGVMLHHVSIALVDATGRPFAGTAAWTAALLGSTGSWSMSLDRRSALVHTLELPRPLALHIEATDSIMVRGHVKIVSGSGPVHIQITLAYEPLGSPLTRFAVMPLAVRLTPRASVVEVPDAAVAHEWVAPVDGRLMVLLGLPADATGELVLEDVESGDTLWREILQPLTGEGFGRRADVVRVGAPVRAGRLYRLTLHAPGPAGTAPDGRQVHALLAPVRSALAVAARD